MDIPDNEQHIENRASNRGAQGNFYEPVNVDQGQHAHGSGIAQANQGSNANVNIVTVGADAERFKAIYQMPSPLPHFVGRQAIIECVTQHLTQVSRDAGAVVIIRGMGGVGKTQLAYTIAHRISAHFRDGQLLIDAHGTSEIPQSAQEIMQRITQAFAPEWQPDSDGL